MAFNPPTFNLTCDIYTGPFLARFLRVAAVDCNLAYGKRVSTNGPENPFNAAETAIVKLLLPAGTDVRDGSVVSGYDVVDVPAGSGRFYAVMYVDDSGKGFSNEHRIADLLKCCDFNGPSEFAGYFWPTPIP